MPSNDWVVILDFEYNTPTQGTKYLTTYTNTSTYGKCDEAHLGIAEQRTEAQCNSLASAFTTAGKSAHAGPRPGTVH